MAPAPRSRSSGCPNAMARSSPGSSGRRRARSPPRSKASVPSRPRRPPSSCAGCRHRRRRSHVPLDAEGGAGALGLARRAGRSTARQRASPSLAARSGLARARLCDDGAAMAARGRACSTSRVTRSRRRGRRARRSTDRAAGCDRVGCGGRARLAGSWPASWSRRRVRPAGVGSRSRARGPIDRRRASARRGAAATGARASSSRSSSASRRSARCSSCSRRGARSGDRGLARLASFAVRAAHALRSSERAREAGFELERSRALLEVVGEAISRLSLSHTLETALERLAELLGTDRVGRLPPRGRPARRSRRAASSKGRTSRSRRPCSPSRSASRGRGACQSTTPRRTSGSRSAHAAGQPSRDRLGDRAAAPRRRPADRAARRLPAAPRPLTPNESALLRRARGAARRRRPERAAARARDARSAASSRGARVGARGSRPLQALYEISRSFAQSLSLDDDARRAREVDRDAARRRRGRDPHARRARRRAPWRARSTSTTNGSTPPCARCSRRPQPLAAAELWRCSSGSEPLVLDARPRGAARRRAALLAPFLEKGSSAAIVPIATPAELLATLTIVSLHPGPPDRGRDRRDRAVDRRPGRARDRQRAPLRASRRRSPTRCSARSCRARRRSCRASSSATSTSRRRGWTSAATSTTT